eukprot:TRINITY_DN1222_c0_g1_i1.p1 TRINITY_DN1222_c0_g1~~TRINITY_DN1222_c0_g1_i1.p1  ORF type:complete len:108 (+),score=6.44 TRINITY_DN1222_c0_g1_i1:29-325(+)
MNSTEVVHRSNERLFAIPGPDDYMAYVTYVEDSNNKTLDLQHTYTNPQYRGQGLAAKVVQSAFEYAEVQGLTVIPTCTYIPVFVQKNPQWSKVLRAKF